MSIMNLYRAETWIISTALCVLSSNAEISSSSAVVSNDLCWAPGHGDCPVVSSRPSDLRQKSPTTESTEPVTWYCQVMSTGRAQMSSAGDVWDWCAAINQLLGGLVVQTSVHCSMFMGHEHGPWTQVLFCLPCSRPVNTVSVYRRPWTPVSNMTPVFTGREHWTWVVCIGLYSQLVMDTFWDVKPVQLVMQQEWQVVVERSCSSARHATAFSKCCSLSVMHLGDPARMVLQ